MADPVYVCVQRSAYYAHWLAWTKSQVLFVTQAQTHITNRCCALWRKDSNKALFLRRHKEAFAEKDLSSVRARTRSHTYT
jgi:hypothetical protein